MYFLYKSADSNAQAWSPNPPKGSTSNKSPKCSERSNQCTPDVSPAQRELKKLEDYWTRNSPVPENSPRLRSKRKVVFDVKQCLGHGRRSVKDNASKEEEPVVEVNNANSKIQDEVQVCSEKANEKNEDNKELANTVKAKDNAKTKFKNQEEMDLWKEVNFQRDQNDTQDGILNKPPRDCCTKSEVKESCSRKETRIRSAGSQKENACFESESKISDVSVNIPSTSTKEDVHDPVVAALDNCTDLGESRDEDDEDYIPPRKKLRSEVTDDELWEGFPLTVSFKRLAPIKKKTKENDITAQNETAVQSTDQAKDYEKNLKIDDHNVGNAEIIDKKDVNGMTENICHQANVDKNEVKTSDESKKSDDCTEIESNNLTEEPKRCVDEEEGKGDLESSTIMMSPEKLMKQSLSQILSFGTEQEPLSDTEANQTDLSLKTQMSKSLSTTLENIFHFSNSEVCQLDNSLFSDIKSLQHSNETTPLRRSRRILELEQIKCVKPIDKHEISKLNDSDIAIGGSDEITDSDDIDNELVHETGKLELDGREETVAVPSEESLLTNREQRVSNIFTKSKTKARLIPPLRIKLKQPLKCTLKKTCGSKGQDHTKKSNDSRSAPKCKLKIKVTVPAQTIQKSKEKVLDVTARSNTEASVSTQLETSQVAKKSQSERAKKKEEKWYG